MSEQEKNIAREFANQIEELVKKSPEDVNSVSVVWDEYGNWSMVGNGCPACMVDYLVKWANENQPKHLSVAEHPSSIH